MARSVAEHTDAVAALLRPLADARTEDVSLWEASGRVLATEVRSPLDLPQFRNSQMDGYAVDSTTVASTPVTLLDAGTIAAGDAGTEPLAPGTVAKIMTGAPIPPGADAVVPVEDTTAEDGKVTVQRGRVAGEFVREAGSDVRAGELLLAAGTVLAARHVAALAAVGVQVVVVRRPPRVAVITTGAELVEAGKPLAPGQIYDSNGITLATALSDNGIDVVSVARSTDDPAVFRDALSAATAIADVVVTSGGVSMGDFEVVKETLAPLGGWFGHVAMQPGGPQGLSVVDGVPVLSFPGNPVSTLVSFEVFAAPLLRAAAGLPAKRSWTCAVAADITSVPNRRQFLRGRITDETVETVSGPGSQLVAGMALANVLIDVPAETTSITAGSTVRVWEL